jgi:crossover junction endodeoxyribonuclease RuvC
MAEKIILGVDPGTNVMGYGVISCDGNKMQLIAMGSIMLSKFDDHMLKLKHIFDRSLYLIDNYHPDELAVEAPFFGKNVQSMLKLGRAQGTSIAAALYRDIPIFEYAPRKIKQSITGNGAASKEQVAAMLTKLLKIEETPKYLDATDGLAVAVTHFFQGGKPESAPGVKSGSWKSFLKNNPDRVK